MKIRSFFKRIRSKKTDTDVAMETTPINNPLDYRKDGSIRPGDPAWNFMHELMEGKGGALAVQREDGTWETKFFGDKA